MDGAAINGHLGVVQWLHANRTEGCSRNALTNACENGYLEVAKWIYEHVTQECATYVIDQVASGVYLDVIKWIAEHNVGGGAYSSDAMENSVENGHLDVVKWLHEHGIEDAAPLAIDRAAANGHLDIVEWLFEYRSESDAKNAVALAAQHGHFDVMLFLYVKLGPSCVQFDFLGPENGDGVGWVIANMEIVQWLYDKNLLPFNLNEFRSEGNYMPALFKHILGLAPASD